MTLFMLAHRPLFFSPHITTILLFPNKKDYKKTRIYRELSSLINANNAQKIKGFTRFCVILFNLPPSPENRFTATTTKYDVVKEKQKTHEGPTLPLGVEEDMKFTVTGDRRRNATENNPKFQKIVQCFISQCSRSFISVIRVLVPKLNARGRLSRSYCRVVHVGSEKEVFLLPDVWTVLNYHQSKCNLVLTDLGYRLKQTNDREKMFHEALKLYRISVQNICPSVRLLVRFQHTKPKLGKRAAMILFNGYITIKTSLQDIQINIRLHWKLRFLKLFVDYTLNNQIWPY